MASACAQEDLSFYDPLLQFFDHFLRGAPAPQWMRDGVPFLVKDTVKSQNDHRVRRTLSFAAALEAQPDGQGLAEEPLLPVFQERLNGSEEQTQSRAGDRTMLESEALRRRAGDGAEEVR